MYSLDEVKKVDPEVAQAIIDEENRQNSHIELIASENWVSKAVMAAMQLYSSLQIIVRELRKQRPVLRYPVAEESLGDRREPVMQDRVQPDLPSGQAAA